MPEKNWVDHESNAVQRPQGDQGRWTLPRWARAWLLGWGMASGFLALIWLVLRSGVKPSRFTYPCQQAAFSAAWIAFGGPLVATLAAARHRLSAGLRTPVGAAVCTAGLLATAGFWAYAVSVPDYRGPAVDPPRGYTAELFQVTECPQDLVGDRFTGVDTLLSLMGENGVKFHRSSTVSATSGPDGIIAADDVVVIKINYQWGDRGGSNVDVLTGLMRCLVDHPDTFTGEIVVCENSQFNSINGFDRSANNAQDHGYSPHDAVVHFADQGWEVSHFDWTVWRYTSVDEFDAGDFDDGYIVYDTHPDFDGRISYPKFTTDFGTRVSVKNGIWHNPSSSYNREKLKFINLPVLKSHHATYGATVCVKNYMGVVTGYLDTNSHSRILNGILGDLQAEIQPADLNILDCIWINANPNSGPSTSYAGATRKDMLMAGIDPVAIDIWAVKNILIPAFIENGYSPPWPFPSADPDDPSSRFRTYLDNSMNYLLAAGYNVTNDLASINVHQRSCVDTPAKLVVGPGAAPGNPPLVRVFPCSQGASHLYEWSAYGTPQWGVNVTTGDTNGDGTDVILTGAGPGAIYGPHVRGFSLSGTPVTGLNFLAYGTNKYGVNVAAGDIDGDGNDEILTGAGPGAVFGPHVRGFDHDGGASVSPVPGVSFFAYGTLKWGVNVACGDVDGDGYDEILTGAGPGAVFGPHVRGWNVDGAAAAAMPGLSFLAYGSNRYGVRVTCGDLDGDGMAEIVTTPGPSPVFGAHVRGWNYDGSALTPINGINFFAWPAATARYGATAYAGADLDEDGRDDLVVGAGPDPEMQTPVLVYRYEGGSTSSWFSLDAFSSEVACGTSVAAGRF